MFYNENTNDDGLMVLVVYFVIERIRRDQIIRRVDLNYRFEWFVHVSIFQNLNV